MRDGDLKHRLCEIDGDGRMLHADSSLPWPQRGRFTVGTMMPHGRRSPFHRMHPTALEDSEAPRGDAMTLAGQKTKKTQLAPGGSSPREAIHHVHQRKGYGRATVGRHDQREIGRETLAQPSHAARQDPTPVEDVV